MSAKAYCKSIVSRASARHVRSSGRSSDTTRPAVVITGASEGIGRAFAIYLGQNGHTLVLLSRNMDALTKVATEAGTDAHALAIDLAVASAPDAIERFLAQRNLHADVLINNAGVSFGGRFETLSPCAVERVLSVNVAAVVRLSHKFLPGMCDLGHGGILNVASLAGFMPGPHQALYFASKAFVLSFSQAIADECASKGVLVMAAAPGPVETRIHGTMKSQWALYRRLFPSFEPDHMAKVLWRGFTSGQRVLIPGITSNLAAVAATFVPNDVLVPIVGILVRPRLRNGRSIV
jgi:short-subunit dehydrogenase